MRNPARWAGAASAIVLHVAVIGLLLQLEPVRSAITNAAPLMVSLVSPPKVIEKPQEPPKPLPIRPRVQRARSIEQPPILTAAPDAPAVTVAPEPPPAPRIVEVAAPPAAPSPSGPPAPPAPAMANAAPPVTPPSFSADYLHNPAPPYPPLAHRTGQQGRVVLRVRVTGLGTADKVEIRSSSGSALLDDAALNAVKRWRFVPARQGEQPVTAWVLVPVTFAIEG